ncbi:MAG: Na/Pi cotransporter family protein [bacterium]|nr:Na/Pi cotransporter family protein [bacterium]
MNTTTLIAVLTGLILFLYGIENFTKEIQSLARVRFREMLVKATRNRFSGTLLGTLITALIQSSTATTVITVGLVSAGLISFGQSLGVIVGANIGTTITAQLVAYKLTAYAPAFMIIGFLISLLGKSLKYVGKGIFYFGLLFFGLDLVSSAIVPIQQDPRILSWFAQLSNPLIALCAGLLFTAIVQSSTMTTGIVVILAGSNLITLPHAISLLLGANIGTTITTILASLQLGLYARRAAVAHTIFNLFGAIILLPLIGPFSSYIQGLGGSLPQQVANAHTIFNVAVAIVFLLFLPKFERLVVTLVPGQEEEILLAPQFLTNHLPQQNTAAITLIEKEMIHSLDTTIQLFDTSLHYLQSPEEQVMNKITKLEFLSDLLDERIEFSLLEFSRRELDKKQAQQVVLLVRISNTIEQLGDLAKDIVTTPRKLNRSQMELSPESYSGITHLYDRLRESMQTLRGTFMTLKKKTGKPVKIRPYESLIRNGYSQHLDELKTNKSSSGSIFVETVSILESSFSKLNELMGLTRQYLRLQGRK